MSLGLDRKGRLKVSERDIERQLIDALTLHGWKILRTNKFCSGNAVVVQGAIEPGMPDLQARRIYRPDSYDLWEILWIEVKTPAGKVSQAQAAWHQEARMRGERVLIARGLEDIEDLLR